MNLFSFGKKVLSNNPKLNNATSILFNAVSFNKIKGRKSNSILISGSFLKGTKISLHGRNNKILFGRNCYLQGCKINIYGNDNTVVLGDEVCAYNAELHIEDNGGCISIGDKTLITGKTHIATIEGKTIKIGKECLFSQNIVLRSGDSHSLLDRTGKRINPSSDINIGDRVWIGYGATILKGSKLLNDSVIATGAILTKKIDKPNVVVGGEPRKNY